MRVYMDQRTTQIFSFNEIGNGAPSNLGIIRPNFQSFFGKGALCLWGEEHVVFQTEFSSHGNKIYISHVKNIHTQESYQIDINVG